MLQKVENRVRILSDLRELASAESLDTFTLIYTNILEHQPDCPVSAIENSVHVSDRFFFFVVLSIKLQITIIASSYFSIEEIKFNIVT